MNAVILSLACLLALAIAVEDKPEADLSTQVPSDQNVSEWNYRTYYGHYYNPYGYYGRGYWRGRRSVDEKKPEDDAVTTADQDINEWHSRGYYGRYPYGYRRHYGHWRGRRDVDISKNEKSKKTYYPGWRYNRGYYGYPYRHSYYYGKHYPSSYSYFYRY